MTTVSSVSSIESIREDVGGTHGYAGFLRAIRDIHHPEHDAMLQWAGGSFDPISFRADSIRFDDPKKRWKIAFEA